MTSHDILLTLGLLTPLALGVAGLNARRCGVDDAPDAVPAIRYAAAAVPMAFGIGAISSLGIGPSSIADAPKLLFFLVLCAITLWSVGVCCWHEQSSQGRDALQRGRGWD